jgi:uncharacterized protein (DUF58 family)
MLQRLRYRVTPGGALFLLALLLTGAGAFLSANNLLFLVFSSMLALLLVSGFLSQLVLAGLQLELILPEHVSARTPTEAKLRLRNLKYLTPSFSIELSGRRDPLRNGPPILTTPVYFPLIPGRATIETNVEIRFPWRGQHNGNLFLFSTRFPFGFLRKTARVTLHQETIVYPCPEAHDGAEALLDNAVGEIQSAQRGGGLEFYRIRPWEPSDSARLVDWKSTARTGDLQVREFARDEQRSVEIYLDRRAGGQDDWFERAVEQCAWLLWELEDRGIPVVLRSEGWVGDELYPALRYLALVAPVAGSSEEAEPPFDPDGVHIVFTVTPEIFEDAGWMTRMD